ncbi:MULTISPECIES: site-specific integrase [unclassified Streptomyces]|uniref:tyrosine-type recombinase/integrase n=1 Tax=unclassified Streptomyces TaxID=2593676 RepID=UPI0020249A01|nr:MULTISPECIES: site-specific integrase [unclassified Streptomyces]MCX4550529.1 site-specific integrase [Streptomyces sp. NBC_01500]WSC21976.1 site-specific integrase [Streptomyces sp. NBC_01766]
MAYIAERKNKAGEVTSYQVKWRLGGARSAPFQTERFDDEPSAEVFKEAVDDNAQQWPSGWVKGAGYVAPTAGVEARYVFEAYARESVKNRTGVEEQYKVAITKELDTYLLPTFGHCDIRSTEHFSKATVSAWVNQMAKTKVWRGSRHKEMSPKTLKNLHGLLSSILREAVMEEPPLRARNPCELTRLPRTDDDGVDDEGDEDMTFLLPEEVEAIVDQLDRPQDQKLVRVKYATGCRWGELTALAKRHALTQDGKRKLRVTRAWKRKPGEGYYLGKPKSRRSRRTIRVTETTWADLIDLGLEDLKPGDLIIHNGKAERLPYSTFYDRWTAAVGRAHKAGTLSAEKFPTLHDLRHSHAAALLSAGRGLTYVQRRLGHESITTTSDRYGHLLPEADDDAMETIERSLTGGRAPEPAVMETVEVGPLLYVAHLDGDLKGFRRREHAQEVVEQWPLDTGRPARLETWSQGWWQRTVTGGMNAVLAHLPDRVWVVTMGPTVYQADGTEVVLGDAHEAYGRWVWEWEETYTTERAVPHAEWRPGEAACTEARAWGTDEVAVRAAYAEARADALRICGHSPYAQSVETGLPQD